MLIPYTGEARTTYDKITDNLNSWYANKIYHNKTYNRYFYINSKGFLHIYGTAKFKFNGRILYQIIDYLLTRDNKLKESGTSKFFDSPEEAANHFKEFYLQ